MTRRSRLLVATVLLGLTPTGRAAEEPAHTRKEDVVYGRKFGTALTMDVLAPKTNKNGLGVIFVVSGGWFSAHEAINIAFTQPFLARGYTVFAVVHGSQPKYTIPEILQDMNRAVRFIRAHAKEYDIDADRLGVYGGSAGGHLSLMQGLAGDAGRPDAKDEVERQSSRVRAVACFYPPTDFLNYGKDGELALGTGVLEGFKAPFDFQEMDPARKTFVPIVDESERRRIGRSISPIYHVSSDDPPVLIIHGDADKLVPIQQAERLVARLNDAKVPAQLVVKRGAGHGWPDLVKDLETMVEWFDGYLKYEPLQN